MEFFLPATLLSTAGVVALIIYVYRNELAKFNARKESVRTVAANLNAHYVDSGTWRYPKMVVDHNGTRFHVGISNQHPNEIGGKFLNLSVTADGMDPQFSFAVTPVSFFKRAGAWLKGNHVMTGDEHFDSKMVVATNRHRSAVDKLLSPMTRQSLLFLNTFKADFKETKEDAGKTEEQKRSERVVLENAAKAVCRKRFELKIEAGKAEFTQLIHLTELENLQDNINAMLSTYVDIDEHFRALEKAAMVKK